MTMSDDKVERKNKIKDLCLKINELLNEAKCDHAERLLICLNYLEFIASITKTPRHEFWGEVFSTVIDNTGKFTNEQEK
jgi:hypothetical protein